MNKNLTCFKAYDIRGKLDIELNDDIAYRIGRAYGEFFKPKKMVLGGDIRLTSESLKKHVALGLQDSGCEVLDIGLSGTEEIYFATSFLKVDGGIEITASHNPIDYNGMKIVSADSKPISGASGLFEIKKLAESNVFEEIDSKLRGTYRKISVIDEYVDKLMSFIDFKNIDKPLKLVINSGNGAAGHVIDAIESRFIENNINVEIFKLHHAPDGNFPNGIPNPLLPECRTDTSDAVRKFKADMGIAFDGDFDRCFLFDENGDFIEGYYIVGLLSESFLKSNPGAKIIHDPRLTWNTVDVVNSNGGVPVMSKTGHAFIKERMRIEDAIYGGEMSAHHYFRDFYYCDSGMVPWLLVSELMCLRNKKLSQLVGERIQKFPASGEINRVINSAELAIQAVQDKYERFASSVDHTDGISMNFENWRFNLRVSNTEPVVRLNVESLGDHDLMVLKTNEILEFLDNF